MQQASRALRLLSVNMTGKRNVANLRSPSFSHASVPTSYLPPDTHLLPGTAVAPGTAASVAPALAPAAAARSGASSGDLLLVPRTADASAEELPRAKRQRCGCNPG